MGLTGHWSSQMMSSIVALLPIVVLGAQQPHLVLVVVDDWGNNDVGYSDPSIISPEMDMLAAQGVKLSACYTWRWCAPTRGALLTGRYPPNTGFEDAPDGPSSTGEIHI